MLCERFVELTHFFVNSGYPEGLVKSILDGIACKPRSLEYVQKSTDAKPFITPWVMTYGTNDVSPFSAYLEVRSGMWEKKGQ